MRKIGKLLPGVIVLMFLSFCFGTWFGGGGTGKLHVPQWTDSVQTGSSEESLQLRSGLVGNEPPVTDNAAAEHKININTADLAQLQTLPGIGEVRAKKILEYREQNGPFLHTSDLLQVNGIGPGILEKIRDLICLEDSYENSDH